ncbi:MAG: hypothetical protein J7454_17015, partial [Roseiflexus sp.]|nr:hypothetical protein [Roseiflexus sp.]
NDVYVGGRFTNAGGVSGANNLARWNGVTWSTVGGANAINGPVYAIAISGNDVYIGGAFTSAGGVRNANRIVIWNGRQWRTVGSGIDNGLVTAIAINRDNLYVGGRFTNAGGSLYADHVARLTRFRVYLPLTIR